MCCPIYFLEVKRGQTRISACPIAQLQEHKLAKDLFLVFIL